MIRPVKNRSSPKPPRRIQVTASNQATGPSTVVNVNNNSSDGWTNTGPSLRPPVKPLQATGEAYWRRRSAAKSHQHPMSPIVYVYSMAIDRQCSGFDEDYISLWLRYENVKPVKHTVSRYLKKGSANRRSHVVRSRVC